MTCLTAPGRLAASLAFVFVTPVLAQTTWLVGPNGAAQINTALASAQPGDVVDVEPGQYEPFDCTAGVTIRAQQPGTVTIASVPGNSVCTLACASGQIANCADLTFSCGIRVTQGRATLSDCSATAAAVPGILHVANATVHLVRCDLNQTAIGGFALAGALYADNADVTAVDCIFDGGPPFNWAFGVWLNNSRMHANNITVNGEDVFTAGGAFQAWNGSTAWIADSSFTSQLVCALYETNSVVHLENVTLNGVSGSPCTTGTAKALLAVAQPAPITTGSGFQLDFRGQPNAVLGVFASQQLATSSLASVLDTPSWLDGTTMHAVGMTVTNATGAASFTWPIPAVPAIAGQQLWFQGVSGLSLPLQTSAIAGGVAR